MKYANLCVLKDHNIPVPKFALYREHQHLTGSLSVRSSGSVSMPGIMKTILFVEPDDVDKAYEEVIASSKTNKALNYLKLKRVADFSVRVIVQEMVLGTSGVMTKINNKVVGEYVNGSGDLLMSGHESGVPINQLIAYKRLCNIYNQIEDIFGKTQEVEFVIDSNNKIWILQSRDFTINRFENVAFDTSDYKIYQEGYSLVKGSFKGEVGNNILCFKKGEELEYLDEKVTGIILESGSKFSHPAMVANTFGIPCIIGIQNLKIGDEIIVQDNTVYKKLNKL